MSIKKIKLFSINTGFVRVRLSQAKSVFLKKVEKCQAKSVFLFKNLRMSVFVSSNAWKKFENFLKIKFRYEFIISKYKFGY